MSHSLNLSLLIKVPPFNHLEAQMVKNLPAMWETRVRSLGWEDPLEKEEANHFNILAWKIPGTGELVGLQPMRSQGSNTT